MSTNEIVGWAFVVGVPIILSLVTLIKPIINLNNSITKLTVSIEQLSKENIDVKKDVKAHGETLEDHEKRIYLMEHKED